MRNSDDERAARRARRSRRAAGTRRGTAGAAPPASRASSASSPPHEIATSCAPRSPPRSRHRHRLLGVARVRHRERERAPGRRTRACGSASARVIGTGSSSLNAAATTSPEMPEPPMPSTTMLRIVSAAREARRRARVAAASCAAASCSGSPATASRKSSDCRSRHCSKVGLMPSASAFFVEPRVLGVVDGLGVVDEQVGDVAVEHAVAPLQPRVVQRCPRRRSRAAGPCPRGTRGSRAASGRAPCARSLAVERPSQPRTSASTSAVCASHDSASGASRFKRSNGSVLLGRRLNHQSPQSTVSPSSRSCSQRGVLGRDAAR